MTGVAVILQFLLRLQRKRLERRIAKRFDTEVSRRIDALLVAEEALQGVRR